MRQSALFTRTRASAPKDEVSRNAELLIRAGFVYKEMAGVYAYLPLGLRVLEKIKAIVREEMAILGADEFLMTTLQRKELWEKTDRWSDEKVDIWFKSQLKNGSEVGLGWSHEEPITEMMRGYLESYRDLPRFVYQFQTKLRNELRAKSGILRGREFLMKDLYSYTRNEEEHQHFYERAIQAYKTIFEKVGLADRTFFTYASGGAFTQFSHEFQTLLDSGEDTIYVSREKGIAINEEIFSDTLLEQLGIARESLEKAAAAEVGNIFSFGTSKSEQLGLTFKDEQGALQPVVLGSYGLGITRLMGVLVEAFSDERGMIWPEPVAPFAIHLLSLGQNALADQVYQDLTAAGLETLYDDRESVSAGEKFADADLIGLPYRVVIGKRAAEAQIAEIKRRPETESQDQALSSLVSFFKK